MADPNINNGFSYINTQFITFAAFTSGYSKGLDYQIQQVRAVPVSHFLPAGELEKKNSKTNLVLLNALVKNYLVKVISEFSRFTSITDEINKHVVAVKSIVSPHQQPSLTSLEGTCTTINDTLTEHLSVFSKWYDSMETQIVTGDARSFKNTIVYILSEFNNTIKTIHKLQTDAIGASDKESREPSEKKTSSKGLQKKIKELQEEVNRLKQEKAVGVGKESPEETGPEATSTAPAEIVVEHSPEEQPKEEIVVFPTAEAILDGAIIGEWVVDVLWKAYETINERTKEEDEEEDEAKQIENRLQDEKKQLEELSGKKTKPQEQVTQEHWDNLSQQVHPQTTPVDSERAQLQQLWDIMHPGEPRPPELKEETDPDKIYEEEY